MRNIEYELVQGAVADELLLGRKSQPQSIITWYKPSRKMPSVDGMYQIFYELNGVISWTVAEPPMMPRPFAWLDLTSIDEEEIANIDVVWWAELPDVPKEEV